MRACVRVLVAGVLVLVVIVVVVAVMVMVVVVMWWLCLCALLCLCLCQAVVAPWPRLVTGQQTMFLISLSSSFDLPLMLL